MHRVVITGRGVVSPIGSDVDTFLTSLDTNVVGIAPAPWSNDESFGWWACVTDFDPLDWLSPKVVEGTDLFAQFAIAATEQSVNESGIDELPTRRTAIVHGSSMGGLRALMKGQHDLERSGEFDRKMMIQVLPNMAASQLAMRYGLHGPQLTVTTACASSVDAIGLAAGMIQLGEVDVALVGATEGGLPSWDGTMEGSFCPVWYDAHARYGMSAQGRDPRRAMIPFDIDRQGIVTGDGSAAVVLESEQHARTRGAHVFADFGGHATLADAYHPSQYRRNPQCRTCCRVPHRDHRARQARRRHRSDQRLRVRRSELINAAAPLRLNNATGDICHAHAPERGTA
ncbi:beta-ketoacyl-[acyl-carrier-protein] synthase family protein [Candidatus Poriferisodalis sp.]|uniref:beta-ketoacyl-[acyl-carrier-protein] synthase family protein n=1 Tax=Candidatus Poriferisodalis sp. TaxID=3101277 RepID=UPI003C6FBBBA